MKKEKFKKAVALRYDEEKDDVPKIVASGQGTIAENILQKAEDHAISIYEDERLVKELLQFKVGAEIPPELYEIVAQILIFVESVDQQKTEKALESENTYEKK